ncbi:hypothetical protein MNBD_GAMMA10-2098 [hydrothermal vent metagenome]|uniref:DUF2244 domain-containing protein n=1 Tax=hydrothermal vent metagenome TaxID=652676 RepID=A0A3B0XQW9_9ZZZZ
MITTDLNKDGFTGNILIEPNRPISWKDNVRFILIFALLSFVIGLVFLLRGFPLVIPFFGLEVILVSAALYLVYKRYASCQVIYFTRDNVIIETGKLHADERIEYQRYWSKFHVEDNANYTIPRLYICSKGTSTDIGEFLNHEDKTQLIELIKHITLSFQQHSHL